jgi:hypothetical protein
MQYPNQTPSVTTKDIPRTTIVTDALCPKTQHDSNEEEEDGKQDDESDG